MTLGLESHLPANGTAAIEDLERAPNADRDAELLDVQPPCRALRRHTEAFARQPKYRLQLKRGLFSNFSIIANRFYVILYDLYKY